MLRLTPEDKRLRGGEPTLASVLRDQLPIRPIDRDGGDEERPASSLSCFSKRLRGGEPTLSSRLRRVQLPIRPTDRAGGDEEMTASCLPHSLGDGCCCCSPSGSCLDPAAAFFVGDEGEWLDNLGRYDSADSDVVSSLVRDAIICGGGDRGKVGIFCGGDLDAGLCGGDLDAGLCGGDLDAGRCG